jgi:hypothetical protein
VTAAGGFLGTPLSNAGYGEPVLDVRLVSADTVDADELAALAARTFPLACPPSVSADNIAAFIDANLSVARFTDYLTDPARVVLTAHRDDRIVGYTMLVHGVSADAALMKTALGVVSDADAGCMWLGVNQRNYRAQRFYSKHGFAVTGNRTFRLGEHVEHDYVMVRRL